MLTPFSDLVSKYRVIFFDAYGVLKNARGVLHGVPELLSWLSKQGKDFYVITNDASRSPAQMAAAYTHAEHGVLIPESKNISSGLLAKDYLRAKVRSGRVAYLGKPTSAFYIESAGLTPLHIGACKSTEEVAAIALLDDEGFDWFRDLNLMLNLIRRVSAPVIVCNPDLVYPVNDQEVGLAVGSLAAMLERIVGKSFVRFGKPDTMMFSHAFACAHENVPNLRKSDVLMVGDTLETDIQGANTFGLDTALVLSGTTRPDQAAMMIEAKGIIPTYLCESVFT